ncbi:zinc finger protein 184-like isoform X1 [Vanessa tameamea]|uniref:Zinc finger protein 184-like isoform X1 n=1 Tax=Vanessa tameamea TaxID=334116 RepID=A0ABM4AP80_VANTA
MKDIKVCRICLIMDVKMYNLHSYSLETYYEVLVGNHTEVENLPKYICYECTAHLQKFYIFRERCLRGQATLIGLLHSCKKITSDVIKKIDRDVFRLSSNIALSQVKCMNVTADVDLDINNDIKTEPFEVIDDREYFDDKDNIKRENSCDDLSLLSSVDKILSSDDDEPLSLHKEKKKEMKMKRRKKISIDKAVKIDREDDLEGTDDTNRVPRESIMIEVKPKRGRPRKNEQKSKKPTAVPKQRRTNNTGGVIEEDFDLENYCDIITLTEEQQKAEILQRQSSSNYVNAIFQCKLCFKGFIDAQAWKHHVSKHEPSAGDLECQICKFRFKTKRILQKHSSNHEKKYACKSCPYVSKSGTQARQHQMWHKGVTYKCQYCDDVLTKWTSYLSHVRMKHPSEFICGVCGYSFVSKLGLAMHKTMMHKTSVDKEKTKTEKDDMPYCPQCDVKFVSMEAYKRHMVTSVKHTQSTDFSTGCRVCGDSFPDAEALRVHHRRLHARARPRNYGKAKPAHAHWPARCDHCSEEIPNAREYWNHFRRVHPDKNYPVQKDYICDICGKGFRGNAFLVYHKRTHFEERAFKCPQCPKAFFNRTNLQMHEKTHSEHRPHPCSMCSKAFKMKGALDRHFRSHTGVKPYACEVCGKAFAQSNSRKLHVRTVHLKQPSPYVSRSRLERRNKAPRNQPPAAQFLY